MYNELSYCHCALPCNGEWRIFTIPPCPNCFVLWDCLQ